MFLKPGGGVTSAEILALGKPLIIYAALPGQENRNATYLLEHNAAMKVKELAVLNKINGTLAKSRTFRANAGKARIWVHH